MDPTSLFLVYQAFFHNFIFTVCFAGGGFLQILGIIIKTAS